MNSLLIKGAILDTQMKDILIKGNIIHKIADRIDEQADEIIDGKGKVVTPSLVNMHTHSAMTLVRGYVEDVLFHKWISKVWDIESHMDEEMLYWGTKLACLEMIKTGTTCFTDQYWNIERTHLAVEESGLRALMTYVFLDNGDADKIHSQRDECQNMYELSRKWDERVHFGVSIHAHYTVCDENIFWVKDFARDHHLLINTHISETQRENVEHYDKYGMSPVQRLDRMGLLSDNLIAAHCVWIDEDDIITLGRRKVNVVHNVNSNLKLASGYKFKYEELRDAGANVCVGTDGCASSNNLDILEAMKTAAILQKAWRRNPSALPLNELMDMATVNGTSALRLNAGKVKEGMLADLLLIDTNSPAFVPNYNFISNLVYSANSSCVDTTICDGKVLMQGRKVKGEEEILKMADKEAQRLVSKCK